MTDPDWRELKYLCGRLLTKRTMQLSQCAGKQRHETRGTALRTIHANLQGKVEAYRCKHCEGWHIGDQAPVRKKWKARRAIRLRAITEESA